MADAGQYLVSFVSQIILGVAGWNIAKKAGYRPVWGLLIVIPIVSLIVILYCAFNQWPIEKELQELKSKE